MPNIILLKPQQIEWYAFPIGWGFLGTDIQSGHFLMLVQTDFDLPMQTTYSTWTEVSHCLPVESIDQINDRMKWMFEYRRQCCCEL
jgi:hypothetical protein